MAASFLAAFAEVEGPKLDQIVYSGPRIEATPTNAELEAAFAEFDYNRLLGEARKLARIRRRDGADGEDALHEELAVLMERRLSFFRMNPERRERLLLRRVSFRLLESRAAPRVASTAALEEAGGEGALAGAQPCRSISPRADEDARYESLPLPGERWTSMQVISAFQRFRDYHGRPPRVSDCRAANQLPSYATVRRHFKSFDEAVLAAGMVPDGLGRRRKRWVPVEAALVCRSFQRRNGDWPNWADLQRHSDHLPSSSAMVRCFGSTRPAEIRRVAEAILKHHDSASA